MMSPLNHLPSFWMFPNNYDINYARQCPDDNEMNEILTGSSFRVNIQIISKSLIDISMFLMESEKE